MAEKERLAKIYNGLRYYWVIDGVEYPQGQNVVPVTHDHYIVGTAYYTNRTKLFMSLGRVEFKGHSYYEKFNVTIYAANFDSKRLVGGRAMGIYGAEKTTRSTLKK